MGGNINKLDYTDKEKIKACFKKLLKKSGVFCDKEIEILFAEVLCC